MGIPENNWSIYPVHQVTRRPLKMKKIELPVVDNSVGSKEDIGDSTDGSEPLIEDSTKAPRMTERWASDDQL